MNSRVHLLRSQRQLKTATGDAFVVALTILRCNNISTTTKRNTFKTLLNELYGSHTIRVNIKPIVAGKVAVFSLLSHWNFPSDRKNIGYFPSFRLFFGHISLRVYLCYDKRSHQFNFNACSKQSDHINWYWQKVFMFLC